jgi:hypothetical protein
VKEWQERDERPYQRPEERSYFGLGVAIVVALVAAGFAA